MNLPTGEYVSTSQVAEALGVGVSTVKRWVEDGILPAQKTAGGHRKLLMADVVELARQSNLPLSETRLSRKRGTIPRAVDATVLAARLYESLIAGDAYSVRKVARDAVGNAMPVEAFGDNVVAPAMHRIGSEWEAGRIDVLHEHRATQVCLGMLHELRSSLEIRARRDRPIAVGGALEGDYSEVPTLLVQMVLLEAGWDAVNLGPNTPLASMGRALTELRPRLVWLSFSHVADEKALAREYEPFYGQAARSEVPVIIGGRALSGPLRSAIPYTAYGDGLNNLAAFARTLLRPPRRPNRGRPKQDARG